MKAAAAAPFEGSYLQLNLGGREVQLCINALCALSAASLTFGQRNRYTLRWTAAGGLNVNGKPFLDKQGRQLFRSFETPTRLYWR